MRRRAEHPAQPGAPQLPSHRHSCNGSHAAETAASAGCSAQNEKKKQHMHRARCAGCWRIGRRYARIVGAAAKGHHPDQTRPACVPGATAGPVLPVQRPISPRQCCRRARAQTVGARNRWQGSWALRTGWPTAPPRRKWTQTAAASRSTSKRDRKPSKNGGCRRRVRRSDGVAMRPP